MKRMLDGQRRLLRVVGCACTALLLAAGAHAQSQEPPPPSGAALLPVLGELRAQGCAGRRTEAPLQPAARLHEAARRMAGGARSAQALRAADYRAQRSFQMNLGGHASPAAVRRTLVQNYCQALTDPRMTEVGVHRAGDAWWIVLAEPFSPPSAGDAGEVAAEVLALTNAARAKPRRCGARSYGAAGALRPNDLLDQAAAAHAREMARHSFLAHEGRDGSGPPERVSRTGYRWRAVGENVAAGQTRAEQVVQDWLRSPGHCANLMNPDFTEMGIAHAVNRESEAGVYWAQVFGRPR